MARDSLYARWKAMRYRCSNPNVTGWKDYGARGVRVCDDWQSFVLFREWAISSGFREGLLIDRIDPSGDYCPSNCRWVNPAQSTANRRGYRNRTSKYKGVCYVSASRKWRATITENNVQIHLGYFTEESAAASAYNEAAKRMHGEFAWLNDV